LVDNRYDGDEEEEEEEEERKLVMKMIVDIGVTEVFVGVGIISMGIMMQALQYLLQ
jgi:hypothetical protein